MCDTLVALGSATLDGAVIFAKNSDREPNEAHHLVQVAAADHPEGSQVACTYVSIPQARHTHAVLLAKPFWMWGAEMGANEHGVVIGNEAVFTRAPYEKGPALTGMDLLRLALERAGDADAALRVLTGLLETYGQGGNCGFTHGFYYHNSFLIADPRQAWVLETAGKHWAAQKVKDVRTISNAITIGGDFDLCSPHLVDYAVERGWCRGEQDFDFARCYSDPLYTHFSDAASRQCATTDALRGSRGRFSPQAAMQALRAHAPRKNGQYSPDHGLTGADVCMHAGFGPVRNSQSAGSMVSQLKEGAALHWFTATSAPCTGIFFPVWIDAGLPDLGRSPTGEYDERALWWQHERLHRAVIQDYAGRLPLYCAGRDQLEAGFLQQAGQMHSAPARERLAFSEGCLGQTRQARANWIADVTAAPVAGRRSFHYTRAWRGFNRQAHFPA